MQIPRRSTHCALGEESFQPDCEYISQIFQSSEGWIRSDYCLSCWEKVSEEQKSQGYSWRGRIPPKQKKMIAKDERALELFRSVAQKEGDPQLLFVLTLYLLRRKQLGTRAKGIYEVFETGEAFKIPSVNLSAEEGERVREQLNRLLEDG